MLYKPAQLWYSHYDYIWAQSLVVSFIEP